MTTQQVLRWNSPPPLVIEPGKYYQTRIDTLYGSLLFDLKPAETPLTVNNFVFLARMGFYQGNCFHRVIDEFIIQGGCPHGDGSGGPGYFINDERVVQEYTRGVLAMANSGPNTNGSQFFIVLAEEIDLNPEFTIFGTLNQGHEVLDMLGRVQVKLNKNEDEFSTPVRRLLIENIFIFEHTSRPDPPQQRPRQPVRGTLVEDDEDDLLPYGQPDPNMHVPSDAQWFR